MNNYTEPVQVDFELFREDLDRLRLGLSSTPIKKDIKPRGTIPDKYNSAIDYYTSVERLEDRYQFHKTLREKKKDKTSDSFIHMADPSRKKGGDVQSYKRVYHSQFLQPILDKLNQHYPQTKSGWVWEPRGFFLYPPGGYMEWHTNEKQPGTRVYFTHAEEGGKSGINFVYEDQDFEKDVVKSPDKQGWQHRSFYVTDAAVEPGNWHCIYSNTTRLSIGFGIVERNVCRIPGALVPSVPRTS
jgi:hypothetical protein